MKCSITLLILIMVPCQASHYRDLSLLLQRLVFSTVHVGSTVAKTNREQFERVLYMKRKPLIACHKRKSGLLENVLSYYYLMSHKGMLLTLDTKKKLMLPQEVEYIPAEIISHGVVVTSPNNFEELMQKIKEPFIACQERGGLGGGITYHRYLMHLEGIPLVTETANELEIPEGTNKSVYAYNIILPNETEGE